MQTGRTNYGKNMNIVVFSCINFNQKKNLNKQGSHESTYIINDWYTFLFTPYFSLPSALRVFTQFSFIFPCKCKLPVRKSTL